MPLCGEERALSRHEQQRLAALHEYRVLDAPADDELEAVVRVAAMVAGVPTATLNLIDEHRQCQLTTAGFTGGDSARSDSMCALRFQAGQFVHVRDARTDPAYRENPWVTGVLADVRFYASAPLVTPQGYALGTLCVFDSVPRELTGGQIERLEDLAGVILALFERRRQARVMAELAAEAEARQRFTDTVLDTIDVAVVAADRSGHLTVFNRTARDWHGLDADPSVEPADFAEHYRLFRADGVTALPSEEIPLLRVLHGGTVSDAELVIRPDGLPARHVVVGGRALTAAGGTPLGAVVAMTDVTADRARQQALRDAHAELLRSNTELEQFAAVVSHDLAAPLAVVNGYLELLGDHYAMEIEAQGRKWIGATVRAVGRMQALIESLLSYARAGSGPCRREPTDLGELVDHALTDLRESIRHGGATVRVTLPAITVSCDPTLVRQLLQNLIGNAVKYRDPARDCQVEVGARREQDEYVVTVRDNGIGIPADQRRRVFEMFARAEAAGPAGHGVGLSTCERIVTRHDGRIWADTAPGGGTTISFTLPASRTAADA
jgi:signal transduction histidine kinase